MGRQLFGTDGIRGVAGKAPLDEATVHAVGAALGVWVRGHGAAEVLIGMDTRESGPWIAGQVAGGLAREGVKTRFAGVLTTPGVAYLTATDTFSAGVMISASHNPYEDNGIKVFSHSGFKLPDEDELRLESLIFERLAAGLEPRKADLAVDAGLDERYLDHLASTLGARLEGVKLVVDCGNGAASYLAPLLLERLGASVSCIGCSPDGRNINLNCGALHLEGLQRAVVEHGADAGFAFDGDADRCLAVSSSGKVIDGDRILLIAARRMKVPLVVATVMSNLGLERALAADGIRLVRAQVGDKYVLEEMLRLKASLGGEQSGHVIFLGAATTGDGLLTALRVLESMQAGGQGLDELTGGFQSYPQKLDKVRVREKRPLEEIGTVADSVRAAEAELGSDGRVLVRYSGTEPVARVMVEGPTEEAVERLTGSIVRVIRAELGA